MKFKKCFIILSDGPVDLAFTVKNEKKTILIAV